MSLNSNRLKELTWNSLRKFIDTHYLKNRVIVSRDIPGILDDIERITGLTVIRHKYHTGEDHGTWIVPPQWDVKEAWLKDSNGRKLASYNDHPLFVASYSKPVRQIISKKELLPHIISEPSQPNAFAYNWRYAMDARLRLKDWGISLPQNQVDKLGDGDYEIYIDVEITDGDMIVGEIVLSGESEDTVLFLADYCHPGQVNDSFSGLAMFMKVMHTLSNLKNRCYTYKLLLFPETIGSAVYIASNPDKLKTVKGAIFSEMVGWGEEWYLKATRRGNTYLDLLAAECCRAFPEIKSSSFFSLIGNDEYMFDSVQVGIPTLSLLKYPYKEYHTSNDEPSRIIDADLQRAVEIILHLVRVAESDKVFEFTNPVPFWLTRFDLYSDDQYEPEDFRRNFDIVYRYLDGRKSVLEISDKVDCPFDVVYSYIKKMYENELVRLKGKFPLNTTIR